MQKREPIWIAGVVCLVDGETILYGVRPAAPDAPLDTSRRLLIHYYGWHPTCTVLLHPTVSYASVERRLCELDGCINVRCERKYRFSRFEGDLDQVEKTPMRCSYECAIITFTSLAMRFAATEKLRRGDIFGIPAQPVKDSATWPWFSQLTETALQEQCWWSVFETHGDLEPERQFWIDHNTTKPHSYIQWTTADELAPRHSTVNTTLDPDVDEVWLKRFDIVPDMDDLPRGMLVAAMDIETASRDYERGRFATPLIDEDYVFCITLTLSRYPQTNSNLQGYVLLYKSPYPYDDNQVKPPPLINATEEYEVIYFDSEMSLIIAYYNMIRSASVILNFNGYIFDNPYLLKRLTQYALHVGSLDTLPPALKKWLTHTSYNDSASKPSANSHSQAPSTDIENLDAQEIDLDSLVADMSDLSLSRDTSNTPDQTSELWSSKDPNRFGFVKWTAGRYLDFHAKLNVKRGTLLPMYLDDMLPWYLAPFAQSPDYRIVTPPVRCDMSSAAAGSGLTYFTHACPHQFDIDVHYWIRQRPQFAGKLKRITLRAVVELVCEILAKTSPDDARVADQQINLFKLEMDFVTMNRNWRKQDYEHIIKYGFRDARVLPFIDNLYRCINDVFSLAQQTYTDPRAIMMRGQSVRLINTRANAVRINGFINDLLQDRYLIKEEESAEILVKSDDMVIDEPVMPDKHYTQCTLGKLNQQIHISTRPPTTERTKPRKKAARKAPKYQGALVLQPAPAIYQGYIPCGDVQSMYPSLMVALAICMSTMITHPEIERRLLMMFIALRIIYIRIYPPGMVPIPPADGPYDEIANAVKHKSVRTLEERDAFDTAMVGQPLPIATSYRQYIEVDNGKWHRCVFVDIAHYRGTPVEHILRGINEYIIRMLKQSRSDTRELQKKYSKKDVMWHVLETLQNVKKVIMNSLYGTLARARPILAEVVTATGRDLLRQMMMYWKTLRYDPEQKAITNNPAHDPLIKRILYGDTDSIFGWLTQLITDDETASRISHELIDRTVAHINLEFVGITMEKIITMLFIIGRKTYAYRTMSGSRVVKGLAIVRRDTIPAIVQLQQVGILTCLQSSNPTTLAAAIKTAETNIRTWVGRMLATDPWHDSGMWSKFTPFADTDFECTKQLADYYVSPETQPHWVCNEDQRRRHPGSEVLTGGRVAFYYVLAAPYHTLQDPPPNSGASEKGVYYARNATRVIQEERHQYRHYISHWLERAMKAMRKSLEITTPYLVTLFAWAHEIAKLREDKQPIFPLSDYDIDPTDGLPNIKFLEKYAARNNKKRKSPDDALPIKTHDIRALIASMPPPAPRANTEASAAMAVDPTDEPLATKQMSRTAKAAKTTPAKRRKNLPKNDPAQKDITSFFR